MNGTAAKAWVALACTAIVTVAIGVKSGLSDGHISTDEWWTILLALLGTIVTPLSVYQATNTPTVPPAAPYFDPSMERM